ncbi:unnamed protein product [Blepharisma stoltei]|uniref:Uncharacterized protein n=1 Tax=Blepharisma stoltei TaxID=1481888 RepID=A0AAU9JJN9_9CILI|nr:unnamed protein product [Blepharisma stoltei]
MILKNWYYINLFLITIKASFISNNFKSVTQMEQEKLRKILSNSSEASGQSIYSHLQEIFSYILREKPEKLYENFESISSFVKANRFLYSEPRPASDLQNIQSRWTVLSNWIRDNEKLLEKYKVKTSQGFIVESHPPALHSLSDFLKDAKLLEFAGISFGEEETYRIQMSLKRLMRSSGAKEMRFWGKIYGREKDYYIAEGLLEGAGKEDVERPKGFEKRGEGVNKYTYWVTDSILEDWIELPDVSPQQIIVARQIKKVFTGNLNADILSYPIFPGKERHLLRAQIARITAATVLAPKGIFKVNEEDPQVIELEEELAVPTFEELSSDESWVHLHANILKAGRVTHAEPEVPEGEEVDVEEIKAKMQDEDPVVDRIKIISEDEPIAEEEKGWQFSLIGDNQVYGAKPPAEGSVCYAANVIRNVRWPGSLTIHKGGAWVNVYIGYGVKRLDPTFNPISPPDVLPDPEDPVEQPEPTPLVAPEELESDSDAEKENDEED